MTKGAMAALSAGVAVFGFDPEPGTPASRALHVLTLKTDPPHRRSGPQGAVPRSGTSRRRRGRHRPGRPSRSPGRPAAPSRRRRGRSGTIPERHGLVLRGGPVRTGSRPWGLVGDRARAAPRRTGRRRAALRPRPASRRHPAARRCGCAGRRRVHRGRPAAPSRGPPRRPGGQRADLQAADPGAARFRRAPSGAGHRGRRPAAPRAPIPVARGHRGQAPGAAPLLGRGRRGRAAGRAPGAPRRLIPRPTLRRRASRARRW